ncbi:Thromboxane-A synthase [Halotydeus destructor]|nr:Thromboxane-A synthase [Halotydeus destructor]
MCSGHADLITVQEKGKLVGVYSFLTPTLLVGDATLAKVVLSTGFNDYVNHPRLQHEDHYMGQSVFSVDDDRWRQVRQIITPAFTSMKLRTMQPLIESSCLDLIEQLQLTNGKSVDMKILLCGFTMDVIASTGFGTKVNTARNPMNDIAVNGRKFLSSDMPLVAILVLSVPWLALGHFQNVLLSGGSQ